VPLQNRAQLSLPSHFRQFHTMDMDRAPGRVITSLSASHEPPVLASDVITVAGSMHVFPRSSWFGRRCGWARLSASRVRCRSAGPAVRVADSQSDSRMRLSIWCRPEQACPMHHNLKHAIRPAWMSQTRCPALTRADFTERSPSASLASFRPPAGRAIAVAFHPGRHRVAPGRAPFRPSPARLSHPLRIPPALS